MLGAEYLEEQLCGLRFRISHNAFFQTNTEMAERLYGIAAEMAALRGGERVFDLFCGIGTLAHPRRERGRGVGHRAGGRGDRRRGGERAAQPDLQRPIPGRRRPQGDPTLLDEAGRPDVVVVDPPRAGLSKKVVRRLIECDAPRIVYVSCNPTTLAPNAAQLSEVGYRLRRVKPVDMFPQTPHIECVALLERT